MSGRNYRSLLATILSKKARSGGAALIASPAYQARLAKPLRKARNESKERVSLKRNGIRLNRHFALASYLSMIFFRKPVSTFRDHALEASNQARTDVLRDDINNTLKEAMKSGDGRRVSTLRLINAAILERETRGAERTTLTDAEIVDVMQKMVKQRQEALELYEKAGRNELAAQEREEIGIISAYLPKQMSDIEAAHAISALIKELEAATLKDMGRTMAALKQRFAGQMDFGKAGAQVKKLLGG
jgi:uncharacterized protein YqeY